MSYRNLEKNLGLAKSLPVTENWSAAADFLQLLSDHCLQHKPATILECSSGTSTLVLSQCCCINDYGHVYSLENGEQFARQTQQQLAGFSLSEYADVYHAPLIKVVTGEGKFEWYDFTKLPSLEIDLLVIDGPPGFLQPYSRYPALPLLADSLAKNCTVFLDDAAREDEQEIVRRWLREFPGFDSQYIANERGCAILQR